MEPKTTRQLAAIMRIHPGRIDQWISRGQFLPRIFAKAGLSRDWSFDEAMRLATFIELVDLCGMDPRIAGVLTQAGVHGFRDDGSYFVAYHGDPDEQATGWSFDIVRKKKIGEFLAGGCPYPKILSAGHSPEVIAENSKPNLGPAYATVMVDLDRLEQRLRDAWSAD